MNKNSNPIVSVTMDNRLSAIVLVGVTVFSTITIFAIPDIAFTIRPESIADSIWHLSGMDLVKILSAYLVVYLLPGIAILRILDKFLEVTNIEKLGFWLLFGFIFSSVLTLTLSYFHLLSVEAYVLILWSLIIISLLKAKGDFHKSSVVTFDHDAALVIATMATISIMAYVLIMNEHHFTGITSGDIRHYSAFANISLNLNEMSRTPYVWFSTPYWLVSAITGLPFLYSHALAQFLIIILPASTYYFIRTILAKRSLASVTVLFVFLGIGITAAYPFSLFVSDPLSIQRYFGADNELFLSEIFETTGSPGTTPFTVNPVVFDLSMMLFASALYLSQITGKSSIVKSAIVAILLSSSIFTHSLSVAAFFLVLLLLTALMRRHYARISGQIILFAAVSISLLEPVSGFFLFGKLFPAISNHSTLLLTAVLLYLTTVFLRYNSHVIHRLNKLSPFLYITRRSGALKQSVIRPSEKVLLMVGAAMFVINLSLFLTDGAINYTSIWQDDTQVLPFYLLVVKFYGPILIFAILGMHLHYLRDRTSFIFVGLFILACFLVMTISLVVPDVIPPSIFFTRYAMYPAIPIVGMALLAVSKKMDSNAKIIRIGTAGFLVTILILASISHGYSRELFVVWGERRSLTDADVSAINWLNNNAATNSKIGVFGDASELLLTNLGQNLVTVPLNHYYSESWYSRPWISDITFSSQSIDASWYILSKMNLSYLMTREVSFQQEVDPNSILSSALRGYPIVYQEGTGEEVKITIYKVPEYKIDENALNILVKPSICEDENFIHLTNALISSGAFFDVVSDIDLLSRHYDESYVFLLSNTCYITSSSTIMEYLPYEAVKMMSDSNGRVRIYRDINQNAIATVDINHPISAETTRLLSSWLEVQENLSAPKTYDYSEKMLNNVVPSIQSVYLTDALQDTAIFKSMALIGNVGIKSERTFEFHDGRYMVIEGVNTLYQNVRVEVRPTNAGEYTFVEIVQQSSDGDRMLDTMWLRNPLFTIQGNVNGFGQVVSPSLNHYSSEFEELSLQGNITILMRENSGLMYVSISS